MGRLPLFLSNERLPFALVFLALPSVATAGPVGVLEARVVDVTDGDTVTLPDPNTVQKKFLVAGIDAPEKDLPFRTPGVPFASRSLRPARQEPGRRRHARRKVAPTPDEYRALVQRRVSRKRWHAPQVFERGLIAIR